MLLMTPTCANEYNPTIQTLAFKQYDTNRIMHYMVKRIFPPWSAAKATSVKWKSLEHTNSEAAAKCGNAPHVKITSLLLHL